MSNLPDSGKRTNFVVGGAYRESDPDKPIMSGISPYALWRLGMVMTRAQSKYGDFRNWERGMPATRYIDAEDRHMKLYGMRDTTEDHLAAAMWNIMALMHHEEVGATDPDTGQHWTWDELDDRPRWGAPLKKETTKWNKRLMQRLMASIRRRFSRTR